VNHVWISLQLQIDSQFLQPTCSKCFTQAFCKYRDFCNKRPLKELDNWLNTSAFQLQVLSYHPSTKLVALMGWVEGLFSTSCSSDLKFLEAREIQEHNPQLTTWHLTQLQLLLFNQFNKSVANSPYACKSTQYTWILFPPWVHTYQKKQAPFFLFTQNPK
jgi:hypothetical protein